MKRTGFKRPSFPRKPAPKLRPVTLPSNVKPFTGPGSVMESVAKQTVVESDHLRASARGEQCTVGHSATCNHDAATVVLAHLPSDIAGYKSTDLSSCYACSGCHAAIDAIGSVPDFEQDRDWILRRAMVRTQTRFIDKGLLFFKGQAS